jgi:hypothetical protein
MVSNRQKENLRTKHIPDRMLELHVCAKLIEACEKLDRKERARLELGKKRYEVLPGRSLLYCAIDTAS